MRPDVAQSYPLAGRYGYYGVVCGFTGWTWRGRDADFPRRKLWTGKGQAAAENQRDCAQSVVYLYGQYCDCDCALSFGGVESF